MNRPTTELSNEELSLHIITLADRADQLVAALNNGQQTWRMRIPVHDDDSDMIVSQLTQAARVAAQRLQSEGS